MEEKIYTKKELADILRMNNNFWNLVVLNNRLHIKEIFNKVNEYYNIDINLEQLLDFNILYLTRKYFTGAYDSFFELLDISDIDFEDKTIKLHPSSSKKLTIKIIRNALSHNNRNNHDLYSLVRKDNKFLFRINLLNSDRKGTPYIEDIDLNRLVDIITQFNNSKRIVYSLFGSDEDGIYLEKNSTIKGNSKEDLSKAFEELMKGNKLELNKLSKAQKKIYFDNNQISTYRYIIDILKNRVDKSTYAEIIKSGALSSSLMPSFPYKEKNIWYLLSLINSLKNNETLYDAFIDIITKKDSRFNDCEALYYSLDFPRTLAFINSIYYEFVFGEILFSDDDKDNGNNYNVRIGNNDYSLEKVRNSFIHERWFVDKDLNMFLYDWASGDNHDMECKNIYMASMKDLNIFSDFVVKNIGNDKSKQLLKLV